MAGCVNDAFANYFRWRVNWVFNYEDKEALLLKEVKPSII
jgi:hypothetical protein